jgi:hypothetical protein
MKIFLLLLISTFLYHCAGGGYRPPTYNPTTYTYKIAGSRQDLFKKAIKTLSAQGYEFTVKDMDNGMVRTVPMENKFTAQECDCGMYYQKLVMHDPFTRVTVELSLTIEDGTVKFLTKFSGVQKNARGKVLRQLECMSKGAYEKFLVERMVGSRLD